MKKIVIWGSIAFAALASCSKEKKQPSSKEDLLTSSPWYLIRFTSQAAGEMPQPRCMQDDPYVFKPDGRLTQTQGATKCYTSDLDYTIEGIWELKNNGTMLGLKWGNTPVLDYQVHTLTRDSLIQSIADFSTVYTFYFAHAY